MQNSQTPNQLKLKNHIFELSNEQNNFSAACNEWDVLYFDLSEYWDNCPCGQDIKELCYIKNSLNGNTTFVGNVCVNKFMAINTTNVVAGLKRIIKNQDANINKALFEFAKQRDWFKSPKEEGFILQTMNKRNLSPAQLSWKQKINWRILNELAKVTNNQLA